MEVPLEKLKNDLFHLNELVKGERTFHQLAYIFDNRILYLDVFSTHKKTYSGYKGTNLFTDNPLAAFIAISEPVK